MKRLALALAATLLMAPQALAFTVGYVDTATVRREAKSFKSAYSELQREQQKFQQEFNSRQKKLEAARKTQKPAEVERLQAQYSKELDSMRQRATRLEASLSAKTTKMALVAIRGVAARKKLDLVLDKGTVYYGGVDITKDVIRSLNK